MKIFRRKPDETIAVICVGLTMIFFVTKMQHWFLPPVVLLIALIGIFSASLSNKIHLAWMKLARAMGFVSSKILLTLVFVFFLSPIALLSRLFSKKKSSFKRENTSSFYMEKNHRFTAKDMEEMW